MATPRRDLGPAIFSARMTFVHGGSAFCPAGVRLLHRRLGGPGCLCVSPVGCCWVWSDRSSYTVWYRRRPLRSLGLRLDNWPQAAALGLLFAGVQFFLTLYGYVLPAPVDWVPLLVMSLTVGLFEAVFFRGFVQTRLEASFEPAVGVGGVAALYAVYQVDYGMGVVEMVFLLSLGVVYTVAFRSCGTCGGPTRVRRRLGVAQVAAQPARPSRNGLAVGARRPPSPALARSKPDLARPPDGESEHRDPRHD